MIWLFDHRTNTSYWLKVFALYALAEACVQLLFFLLLNNFDNKTNSNLVYHLVMWIFQCFLILPIWCVAWLARKQKIITQVLINLLFFFVYSYCWFVPIQDVIPLVYNNLLNIFIPGAERMDKTFDSTLFYPFLNYHILKHAFRLSWFYLANYFYSFRIEERKKFELAISNRDLQMKLLKWHLNPSFYFKTINYLQKSAEQQPSNATEPILQLAKVMEYVIYEAREPLIELKKEIGFLSNFTELISRQTNNKVSIDFTYGEGFEKLKIAPLLLAGIVDGIVTDISNQDNGYFSIRMDFTGSVMQFSIKGIEVEPETPALLDKLYKGKYSIEYSSEKMFKLNLHLHEE